MNKEKEEGNPFKKRKEEDYIGSLDFMPLV